MPVRLAKSLLVALLITAMGGHLILLQTAAWVGMTVRYSQKDCLLVALQKTFDGKHPCRLCKIVSKETKSEKQKDSPPLQLKLEFLCHMNAALSGSPPFPKIELNAVAFWLRSQPPPLPPPRSLLL